MAAKTLKMRLSYTKLINNKIGWYSMTLSVSCMLNSPVHFNEVEDDLSDN